GLLCRGDRVLVAVSGGADSVGLLDLLNLVREQYQLTLVGFHLNHGLRPAARHDQEFVSGLFRKLGVELVVRRARVRLFARHHKLGVEEAGRVLRYRHMVRVARERDCNRVALGHTANDNLETMLLNLCRGTGPTGFAGIPVCRGIFIRPLIDIARPALEQHLRARGLEWVEDESNEDLEFRRNLIRHRVVPVLEQVNPRVVVHARRAAQLIEDESRLLDRIAAQAAVKCSRVRGDLVRIDTVRFRNYNTALKRRVVRHLLPGLDSEEVESIIRLCHGRPGARLVLAKGLVGRHSSGFVELRLSKESFRNG
ncbi:MAG: tRNA lysidine(34) synthetase TilS, partial [candidate division WOR-3 bacterium]